MKLDTDDSPLMCQCSPKMEKPCTIESQCMNKMLMYECHPDMCPAGAKCHNQNFVQRKYPNMKAFHTADRGWGLKTLDRIKEGHFVIEYVGELIDEMEYKHRLQRKKETKNEDYYFLTLDSNRIIDAEPKGNLSRFMSWLNFHICCKLCEKCSKHLIILEFPDHSCQPNCETEKWMVNGNVRIGLFAMRDIKVGEELTFNYLLQTDGDDRKPCLCKAPNCTGWIGGKPGKSNMKTETTKVPDKQHTSSGKKG